MADRPNVLLINVDQQRYDSLGFTGNPIVQTPNLDALAGQGISFTHAFCPLPLCCPARQTLLSSLTPEVHGSFWVYGVGHVTPDFSPEHDIWVRHLQREGYGTAYVGKWHVNPKIDPTGYGFDLYAPDRYPHRRPNFAGWDLARIREIIGLTDEGDVETSSTHRLADDALAFIDRFAAEGRPWHVRLDYAQPHSPCYPAGRFATLYDRRAIPPWGSFAETFANKPYIQRQQLYTWNVDEWTWEEWSQYVANYFGIISQIDDAIGRVIRRLEERDLTRETVIIYTTDHGDLAGGHRTMEKVHNLYEELVRVPLVVCWDGVISPGQTCDDFISHYLDLGPTVLDLLGLPIPASYQGVSMLPQLRGEANPVTRDCITASCHGQQFGLYSQRMLRDRRYKLVYNFTDINEFYDLQEDPFELTNLAVDPAKQQLILEYQHRLFHELKKLRDPIVDTKWVENQMLGEGRKLSR